MSKQFAETRLENLVGYAVAGTPVLGLHGTAEARLLVAAVINFSYGAGDVTQLEIAYNAPPANSPTWLHRLTLAGPLGGGGGSLHVGFAAEGVGQVVDITPDVADRIHTVRLPKFPLTAGTLLQFVAANAGTVLHATSIAITESSPPWAGGEQ